MSSVKTVEKTDKAATNSSAKVFDIAKPGKSAPSASARPVIVANRTVMRDPMVAPLDTDEALPAKPINKITLQPLGETETKERADNDKPADQVPVLTADETTLAEPADMPAEEKTAEPSDAPEAPQQEADSPAVDGAHNGTSSAEESAPPSDAASTDAVVDDAAMPLEDGVNADAKPDPEIAALEARVKQEEAIGQLVDSKEFFLPINALERHRSKVMSVLGLVPILLLGLVLIDLLMDAGMVHVSGVHPLTHFFTTY